MNLAKTRSSLPPIDAPSWFAHAGEVIKSIGTEFFHREFIKLLEASIRSDAVWVIRYSGEALPDVVHTRNVSAPAARTYAEQCSGVDPFSQRWRLKREAGVFTLASLRNDSVEYQLYVKLFLPAAGVDDELGVFFPVTAHNCFAYFLEREHGLFTPAEVKRAELMFPALEAFHRAHLGWMFNELRHSNAPETAGLINRPTLIQDRSGQKVYSNESWNGFATLNPSLSPRLEELSAGGLNQIEFDDHVLKSEAMGIDFPLAPGGRMFVIERQSADRAAQRDRISNVLRAFTARERDILALVMCGKNSAEISNRLKISVGAVRNCKLRIYRKADVATERALVKKLMPLYEPS